MKQNTTSTKKNTTKTVKKKKKKRHQDYNAHFQGYSFFSLGSQQT